MGYGSLSGFFYYYQFPVLMTCFHTAALISRIVLIDNNKPKYARWLPHQSYKVPTEMEELLEKGMIVIYDYAIKIFNRICELYLSRKSIEKRKKMC